MKGFLKSKKALSPVVAAIILIAVTVAVSIAVAAWMGSLTMGFTETEQLTITSISFPSNSTITVNYQNTGTSDVTITSATVTGGTVTGASLTQETLEKGTSGSLTVTVEPTGAIQSGVAYNVKILSAKGNQFTYTATA